MYYFGEHKLTPDLFEELMASAHDIAVDIETVSLKDTTIMGIGIAPTIDDAFYFEQGELHHPLEYIQDPDYNKIYHNCMFDLMQLPNPDTLTIGDTAFLARLLGFPGSLETLAFSLYMKGLAPYRPAFGMKEVLEVLNVKKTSDMDSRLLAEKCAMDCMATLNVYNAMCSLLPSNLGKAYQLDICIVPILLRMSKRGLKLDGEQVSKLVIEYESKVEGLLQACQVLGCENPASPDQVAAALQKRGALFPKKVRGSWKVETDKDVLKYSTDMLAQAVVKFREAHYFLTHYARPLVGKERQYTHFHLDASTSRMSGYNMNLMNLPKGSARNCFLPDSGTFTCADASQMQLRILAHLSQDPVMMRVFEDPDGDIHQETADFFGVERSSLIKSVNFGVIFGATAQSLMETANVSDIGQAQNLLKQWGKKYKKAWEWINNQHEVGLRDGYVYTDYGRKLYIPMELGKAHAERCTVNYPIQGTEAEIVKRWMYICRNLLQALVVHDEMIFDGYVEQLPSEVNGVANFWQPINTKYKERWS